jgi:predicted XRE-type DNA-binding protein
MGQNIFLETGFSDEDATVLAIETDIAIAIAQYIRTQFPTSQTAAAKHLKIGQNEVSAILNANTSRFSLPKLIRIARRAGLRMYMDMGENAHGACAKTVAPSVAQSAATFAYAQSEGILTAALDAAEFATPSESERKTQRFS